MVVLPGLALLYARSRLGVPIDQDLGDDLAGPQACRVIVDLGRDDQLVGLRAGDQSPQLLGDLSRRADGGAREHALEHDLLLGREALAETGERWGQRPGPPEPER